MSPYRLLLVEDDVRLAALIAEFLGNYEFVVHVVGSGTDAVDRFGQLTPDVVILDLMLPGLDGVEVCRRIRNAARTPILMLTARADIYDQIAGLEIGADDYVLKPVEPRLLLARLRAILRRTAVESPAAEPTHPSRIVFGQLCIDELAREAQWKGKVLDLKTVEYNLLRVFALSPGVVLSRDDLMRSLRGVGFDGLDRTIDAGVSRLRRRFDDLAQEPQKIKTVWGQGYLFNPYAWED